VRTESLAPVLRYLRKVAAPASSNDSADAELLARFALYRDEAAFTSLVRRHGPMVLAVCRRVVRDGHAAEDAFQATFLVLARKAGSLARPELLGHWLYGVAYRTAAKAKSEANRRRARERQAVRKHQIDPDDECDRHDLRGLLDEEVNRLPERYRVPVVLCYLQGRTNAEAAQRLGCSRGTVATLLARAREKLRRRLIQRGVGLSVGAALAALTGPAKSCVVSTALEQGIVKAATLVAAGQTQAAGALAAQAVALAKGVCKGMLMEKLKIPAALLMMTVLVSAGAGIGIYRAGAQESQITASDAETKPRPPSQTEQPRKRLAGPAEKGKEETATIRTDNFLVTAPTRDVAWRIGEAAEQHRKALARLWLGKELPNWDERCPIRVTVTGGAAGSSSTFSFEDGKVQRSGMRLEGSLDRIFADLLPHEMTHVILAEGRSRRLPRWADEGAATLSESAAGRAKHERVMVKLLRSERLLPLCDLLPRLDYPRDVMAFYAESLSLTDFLVSVGGRKKFLAFVAQGERDGWDRAAKSTYGYKTVEVLEHVWLEQARKRLADKETKEPLHGEKVSRISQNPQRRTRTIEGRLPAGPAPEAILVKLDEDGDLLVLRKVLAYQPVTTEVTLKDGRRQRATSYRQAHFGQLAVYDPTTIRVHDTKGKAVDVKELRKRLKGETLALISADGRPVDPLYFRLYKEDTLVFVIPPRTPPPVSGGPVPAPPAAPVRDRSFIEQNDKQAGELDPLSTPVRTVPRQTAPVTPPPAVREPN
jgi:RNA polymerase sigma factor (sigma-70 family)